VRRSHEGPLLVQRVFQPELETAGPCHAYIVHPPGGVVSGDELSLTVRVAPQARTLLTSAAAGKFYRSPDGNRAGRLAQRFEIDHGELEWLPLENLYYPCAIVEVSTRIDLTGESRFIGWEIGCLGLPAQSRRFESGRVHQGIELWRGGHPLWIERMHFDGVSADAMWGLAGHAAFGSWLAYPAGPPELEQARSATAQCSGTELVVAWTLVDHVLCGRARARRADRLRAAFIEAWGSLRPALLGRSAHAPRIWST